MYAWQPLDAGGHELAVFGSFQWGVIILSLRSRGEFVLVGDLMKSVCLLRLNNEGTPLTEVRSCAHTSAWWWSHD